jgi:hypothetical protein
MQVKKTFESIASLVIDFSVQYINIKGAEINKLKESLFYIILWRVYPLLGNCPVNTYSQAYACNRRTSIGRERTNKHALLTIEGVFSVWSVPRSYKRTQKTRVDSRIDASLPGYDLGIELSWQL